MLKLYLELKEEDEMPVFIWEKDAFLKFVEAESSGDKNIAASLIRHQRDFGKCSFWAFYQRWQEMYVIDPEITKTQPSFSIDVEGNYAIYGYGGWNRYMVLNTGEIVFLREFAERDEDLRLGEKAGFRISPVSPDR